jgi:hypothetical protein
MFGDRPEQRFTDMFGFVPQNHGLFIHTFPDWSSIEAVYHKDYYASPIFDREYTILVTREGIVLNPRHLTTGAGV